MSLYGDKKPVIGKSNPFQSQENVNGDVYFRDDSGMFKLENLKWKKLTKSFNAVYDVFGVGSYAKDGNGKAYEAKTLYDGKDEEKEIGTVLLIVPVEKRFADQQQRELEELEAEEAAAKKTVKKSKAKTTKAPVKKSTTKSTKAKTATSAVAKKVTAKKTTTVAKKTIAKKTVKKVKAKRPLNAYMRFAIDERKKVVKANPKMCITDVARELGKRYQKLTDAEKEGYKNLAKKEFSK